MTHRDRPSIGRIVHYMTGEEPGPTCWAAIVTDVDPADSGQVALTVFPPLSLPGYLEDPIPYSSTVGAGSRGTWHWHTDHTPETEDWRPCGACYSPSANRAHREACRGPIAVTPEGLTLPTNESD